MYRQTLWFCKRGTSKVAYYHCPICKEDQTDIDEGTYVQVGNVAHALICQTCIPIAKQKIDEMFRGALVEVDDAGYRLTSDKTPTSKPPKG